MTTRVAARLRQLDRVERLGQRPDLVHLDQDRVGDALVDATAEALDVRDEEVVSDELKPVAEALGQRSPGGPIVLGEAVLDRDDRVPLGQLLPEARPFPRRPPRGLRSVAPVAVELGRSRVERDRDALAVARTLGGLEHGVDRLLARAEVGREAALVADSCREAALVQQALQRVEDLGADPQRLREGVRAGRHDHEFLQVDRVLRRARRR